MSDSPNKHTDGNLRVSVFSNGNAIQDSLFGLVSVYIYKAVNKIGKAVIVFSAGDMANSNIPESEDDTFAPGKKVRIEAGYGDDESPVFEGIVISHNVVIGEGNETTLQVECRDYAFPATLARKNNTFEKKKDSEAIQQVLGNYPNLSPSVDATTTKYNDLVQYYCTDWDFVLSRADANGLVVVTDGGDIKVKAPATGDSPSLKVTYGIDVIGFRGELSASDQLAEFEANAWDAAAQAKVSVSAQKPSLPSQGSDSVSKLTEAVGNENMTLQTELTEQESALQAWGDSQRLKTGLAKILGYCKFPGSAKAVHGKTIELDGFGKRFNGTAYVGYVEHEIKDGEWTTTAGLGLPYENITDKPDVSAPPASGLLPGIQGLHVGTVSKLNEDPAGENRIQVEIPVIGKTVWARLGNLWASSSYGGFFVPDVGDEVVLGFFNNDPCYPVILGSLYSSARNCAYELTAENNIRSITTKSKMKIEFEEEKKVITIATPAKNKIVISDEDKGLSITDQNNNKIVMNDSGVLIESAKELTLKAKTNIVVEAGASMNLKAKSKLDIKGMNVAANADTEITLKGNAKAELSASGQTVVKGAMVMIN